MRKPCVIEHLSLVGVAYAATEVTSKGGWKYSYFEFLQVFFNRNLTRVYEKITNAPYTKKVYIKFNY